jgi:ATP-dependent helicase/nuclease subunit B
VSNIGAIALGATLPASGIERICVYCEVRGLCRKGAW